MKDILAEFDRILRSSGDDGMTIEEIAIAKNQSLPAVTRAVKQFIREGVMEYAGKKSLPNITGALQPRPAYRLTSKKSPKKKARR